MNRSRLSWMAAAMLVIALGYGDAANAQGDKSGREREQLRKLQSANGKLQQEVSALQAAKTKLEQELKELAGQTQALKSSADAGARRRAALEKELAKTLATARADTDTERKEKTALAQKLAALASSQESLAGQHKQIVLASQASETERRRLDAAAAAQSAALRKEIAMCGDRNEKLHQLGIELLDRYQKKGVRDALLQAEPFTGIKSVEVENLVEAYRDKLDAQKVTPGAH